MGRRNCDTLSRRWACCSADKLISAWTELKNTYLRKNMVLQTSRCDTVIASTANGRVEEIVIEMLRKRKSSSIWLPHVILSGVTFL